jgi:hypothetical protein
MFAGVARNVLISAAAFFAVSVVGLLLVPALISAYGLTGFGQITLARLFVPLAAPAIVKHPFRVMKQQFGHVKVYYRSLAKNTAQLRTLFALSKLWIARQKLLALDGGVHPNSDLPWQGHKYEVAGLWKAFDRVEQWF